MIEKIDDNIYARIVDDKIVSMYKKEAFVSIWVMDKKRKGFHFKCKGRWGNEIITHVYRKLGGEITKENAHNHHMEGIRLRYEE